LETSALREALEQSERERRVVEEQRAAMAAQLHRERAAVEAAAEAQRELQLTQRQLRQPHERSVPRSTRRSASFVTAPSSPELPSSPARTHTHSLDGEGIASGVDEQHVMEYLLRLHAEVETDTQQVMPPSRSMSLPSPSPSRGRSPPSSRSSSPSSSSCALAPASVMATSPASSSSLTSKRLATVPAERHLLKAQLDSQDAALPNVPPESYRDNYRGDSAREHDAPASPRVGQVRANANPYVTRFVRSKLRLWVPTLADTIGNFLGAPPTSHECAATGLRIFTIASSPRPQSAAARAGKWKAMGDELVAAKLALQREARLAEAARAALTTKEAEREAAVLRMLAAQGAAQAAELQTQAATAAVALAQRTAAQQQAAAEAKVESVVPYLSIHPQLA
jgi:hypothetical protein